MPPIEYLSIGGYIDKGSPNHMPFPDEPWGRNGDGHIRPDVLAPRMYLPIPYCEAKTPSEKLSFFGGTCGSATLTAGVCAHILSLYPNLSIETLKNALIMFGVPIEGYDNPAPKVNVKNVIDAISHGYKFSGPYSYAPAIKVRLQKPRSLEERKLFWECLSNEDECGVRGFLLYGLLDEATKEEIDLWISWSTDINWSVRWCVCEYLDKFSDFPKLDKTDDPFLIKEKALPVFEWYMKKQINNSLF